MSFAEKHHKLNYLLELITKGNSGNAGFLAEKLNVSTRTVKNYIACLNEMGHKIGYCPICKKYLKKE